MTGLFNPRAPLWAALIYKLWIFLVLSLILFLFGKILYYQINQLLLSFVFYSVFVFFLFFWVKELYKIYSSGSPSAIVSVENDTLTCSSSGYPRPTILWYTCPGVQDTYVPTRLTVIRAGSAPYRLHSKTCWWFIC